jgi:hypothetical protein
MTLLKANLHMSPEAPELTIEEHDRAMDSLIPSRDVMLWSELVAECAILELYRGQLSKMREQEVPDYDGIEEQEERVRWQMHHISNLRDQYAKATTV